MLSCDVSCLIDSEESPLYSAGTGGTSESESSGFEDFQKDERDLRFDLTLVMLGCR